MPSARSRSLSPPCPLSSSLPLLLLPLLLLLAAAAASAGAASKWERVTHVAYLDVAIDGAPASRVKIGLFGAAVPATARNFLALARNEGAGDAAAAATGGKGRGFAGSPFHRIISGFMAQGGDTTHGTGVGGLTAAGRRHMPDENFKVRHAAAGYVSMANAGPHTGSSQFFITFAGAPWLDGKHVVFGRVLGAESMRVVRALEAVGSQSGVPSATATIVGSGELPLEDVAGVLERGGGGEEEGEEEGGGGDAREL